MLFLTDPALERPDVEKRDQNGQTRKGETNQPVEDERQICQLPFQDRLAANQHPQCSQQNQGAEPSAAGGSVKSHSRTVAWNRIWEIEETQRWRCGVMECWSDGNRCRLLFVASLHCPKLSLDFRLAL